MVDIPLTIQLLLDTEGDSQWVHWDRHFILGSCPVYDFADSPRDIYISYPDFSFDPKGPQPEKPLASLGWLVAQGARVLDERRVQPSRPHPSIVVIASAGTATGLTPEEPVPDLRARLLERVPAHKRESPEATRLVDMLLSKPKLFTPLARDELTETVEFKLVGPDPEPVSFRVPAPRGERGEAMMAAIEKLVADGGALTVPWDTPSYGFCFMVPKSGGRWRFTCNPAGINAATARVDTEGILPPDMLREAMQVGILPFLVQLDLAEAFRTLKLGPTAQRLSTFTTPFAKIANDPGLVRLALFPSPLLPRTHGEGYFANSRCAPIYRRGRVGGRRFAGGQVV